MAFTSSSLARFSGRLAAAGLAMAALAVPAFADLSNVIFQIEASNGSGSGVWSATVDQGTWNGDTFTWTQTAPVTITDSVSGAPVATLNHATFSAVADPQVALFFDVVAGNSATDFTIDTGLLSFPALTNPTAVASVGMTVTDADVSGAASLAGLGGATSDRAYLAHYNGMVPGGTPFAQLITSISVSNPNGSSSDNGNTGLLPIGGSVSDMSAQVNFRLSANDAASGTSNFVIIPEPAGLALLALGLGLIRRR